jgi:hypothetical protein
MRSTVKLVIAAITASTLLASASAQSFWVARPNGISYGGKVSAGHNNNPLYDLDIRSVDRNPAVIETYRSSGASTGLLSLNHSSDGIGIEGRATADFGMPYGVVGTSYASRGYGVQGRAPRGTAVSGRTTDGTAIVGEVYGDGHASMFLGGPNYFEGNVGIGVVNPAAALHLARSARVDTNKRINFGAPYENTDNMFVARINRAEPPSTDNSELVVNLGNDTGGGNVDRLIITIQEGITRRFEFNTNGEAYKTTAGGWAAFSDRRVKRDIHELDGSLDKLMDLRGVRFHYKDPDAIGASPGEHVGFIAQEVEEVFPEWIGEYRDGTKTLTIAGFEALAVEALRELRAEKDAQIGRLEAETEALRTRNAELTERLEAIEAALGEIRSTN